MDKPQRAVGPKRHPERHGQGRLSALLVADQVVAVGPQEGEGRRLITVSPSAEAGGALPEAEGPAALAAAPVKAVDGVGTALSPALGSRAPSPQLPLRGPILVTKEDPRAPPARWHVDHLLARPIQR